MLTKLFDFISIEFTVMLTAALPVIELKGAIPVGISLGLSPWHAFLLSFMGSMFPMPFILFTVRPVFNYLRKTRALRRFIEYLTDSSYNKSGRVQKYGAWGLLVFVAIPLPGTGVWTGSIIASLLDMRFKLAFPAIFVGNLIAGLLIMGITNGVFNLYLY
ncbi:MAG: small multi-drug export protein [Gudongella sp.]|jgi:uncharacterized membrane protein|nr:small multi-drug export protein [Gudongella sp.]